MIKVKLKRSLIGLKPKQKKTIQALGLRKINQIKELPENDAVLGMIKKVQTLVEVVK
ncbi:50S ribosomal protein L30 [Desulfonauticus submarinus]